MDNQNIRMLILYKHNRSKGSSKPVQVYEPLVWYTHEWLFIVKQCANGVGMNSYTTEDSNISETYTCGFLECSNQHDIKQKWTSIRSFHDIKLIGPWWCPMVAQNKIITGTGKGLQSDGTKPSPGPEKTFNLSCSVDLMSVSQEILIN